MNAITNLRFLASATCLAIIVATSVNGQSNATLSGPVLGYVFNAPEGKLRPLRGVLGSATIGDPLPFDFAMTQAWTLDKSHAVVSTSTSAELLALSLETPVSVTAISGAPSDPSQAAVSVHGKAGAFYYARSQHLGIVTGFPGSPSVSQSIDLSFLRGQPLTNVAVSDDGALVIYSIMEADRESLYVWTPSASSSRFVFSVESVGGIAIAESGLAFVTDRVANEVFAISDTRNSAVSQFLLGERDGMLRPAGVAISANNQIYIANTGSATLVTLDSNGRLLRTLDCNCDISGLNVLRDSVFRLTDRLDRAVYLLETNSSGDRIQFIPALRPGR